MSHRSFGPLLSPARLEQVLGLVIHKMSPPRGGLFGGMVNGHYSLKTQNQL